ncbi:protein OCTOPUS [Amaranthus tricolor]|uniref:protein OCTOPUS n=1 Tax=Amaranthus tricolor TaxID=29722 RepID=UPI00258ACC58|nr:protein OCTOPUS [Amaranthus tricolor]
MAEPPPNPKPRRLTQCYRHPNLPTTTGLCAPCLRERLSLLNPSPPCAEPSTSSSCSGVIPELRRCKTFSAKNCDVVGMEEPRRRSCDVRGRNSLSCLFDIDDHDNVGDAVVSVESRNLGFLKEEEEEREEVEVESEVRVSDFGNVDHEFEESKTMEELIDIELKSSNSKKKDLKEIAGSFWIAASVFSKKFRKWGKKQKKERECNENNAGLGEMKLENLRGRRLRDTQSEVGEYGLGRRSCDTDPRGSIDFGRASVDCGGFGRRSCDTDPRFSIDLGRASVDCGRISFDEHGRNEFQAPRVSWDGYLLGGRAALPGGNPNVNSAPIVSVIENAMATVYGFDNRMLSEGKMKVENGIDKERWRNGFDRFSSVRREAMVVEDCEPKGLSNARASPAAIGTFNESKLLISEKELNEWRLKSISTRDDNSSESFETASKDLASVSSSSNGNGFKKCRQWSKLWSIWGLLNRKKGDKFRNEGEREYLENPDAESMYDSSRKLTRSQSNSSLRSSSMVVGSASGMTGRNESKAIVKSRQEAVVLSRNRSARYSPNHLDNGLLRFYLTPLRSRRRNRVGKSRMKNSKSLARSVLRL